MADLDLRGFDLFPTKVTFESQRPTETLDGPPIPCIRVGYKLKARCFLFQHVGDGPTMSGIQPGQWFALYTGEDAVAYREAINKCEPAGRTLDELKKFVEQTILEHFGD